MSLIRALSRAEKLPVRSAAEHGTGTANTALRRTAGRLARVRIDAATGANARTRPMTPILKYRLKTVATMLGLSLRLERPRRRSMAQFCRHLKRLGYAPGTIVDVGVADGTFDLYSAFPAATYLLVEPLCEFEPALSWIASRYDAQYALAAAGAEEDERLVHFGDTLA
jgi:hypothetical protein